MQIAATRKNHVRKVDYTDCLFGEVFQNLLQLSNSGVEMIENYSETQIKYFFNPHLIFWALLRFCFNNSTKGQYNRH